jgi:hypothetical protein
MIRHWPILALFCLLTIVSLTLPAQGQSKGSAPKPAQDAQLYRNLTFGFRYRIPFGWVDRTQDMRGEASDSGETPDPSSPPPASAGKNPVKGKNTPQGEVLLAVFERPPDATGDSVNSAVVIASENAGAYPGLKKAEDCLGSLTELTTAKGFKPDGDPSIAAIDGRELVRADFSKPLTDKIAMHQSTLILLIKGKILFFTFIAGSEDEVDDLIDRLYFAATRAQ